MTRSKKILLASLTVGITLGGMALISPGTTVAQDKPVEPGDILCTPFGIGSCAANNRSAEDNDRWMPKMTAIGIKSFRCANTGLGAVEPTEGNWYWSTVDRQIHYLITDQHIQFGGILHGTCAWNDKTQHGLPIKNLPAWSTYVTELVKHVGGKIKYWEVWNEPPNGTDRSQTAEDYGKVVAAAYDAAHAVDPTCKIGIAAKSAHINYLDTAIKGSAKNHFDYITLHPYELLGVSTSHPGAESLFMHIVPTTRKMLKAQNPEKENVPIIFTELGSDAKKDPTAPARALVKAYTMGIAQGVACIQWFEGMDGDSGPMGLLDRKGTPRPAYTAYGQMIQHLSANPVYLGYLLLNDKDYGFVFQGAKGTVMIAWAPFGQTDNVDFGQAEQIIDPLTGTASNASTYTLTNSPIIVLDIAEKLVTQAKDNKSKPFPWDGDFTNAAAVSITMGEKNIEKGLHTLSAASIAADVLTYGGSARAGTVPGGNIYVVDPNFLSYTSSPIEITAVVRLAPGDNPTPMTLNLEYEATDYQGNGYKKAQPQSIPDNKDWHTLTWKIDDAQFVNTWGYSFRFNSGKYSIQSVTVTKVTGNSSNTLP